MSMSPHETRLRKVRMRAWHRGMKEMDLILGRFVDANLARMDDASLDAFEAMMDENDQDLYLWVTGARPAPAQHAAILARIAKDAGITPATESP